VRAAIAGGMAEYRNALEAFAKVSLVQVELARQLDIEIEKINPVLDEIDKVKNVDVAEIITQSAVRHRNTIIVFVAILLLSTAAVAAGAWLVARNVTRPIENLRGTMQKLQQGDNEARAEMMGRDELGQLAYNFNSMMDERFAVQTRIQTENDKLNDSVLGLLQAVAQLSRRDLTIKVPVTEDVTGPVADALNLMTGETAKVLLLVSSLSADVTSASFKVKEQSDSVMAGAADGQREVEFTAQSLGATAEAMNRIAALAEICNTAADNAIKNTETALLSVNSTVGGINGIRDTIRETEKRIKRLGERSQEISGVVNLINTIAERTHILALNASMHAASAGEAERGFAVVADEVQRLAENARQATAEISTLVRQYPA